MVSEVVKDQPEVVSSPRVYVISRPCLDLAVLDRFLAEESLDWRRSEGVTQPEELVEIGGRICYMSFGTLQSQRTTAEYIRNLVAMGHESVLEHATWTFIAVGVSRAFSHQLVRHRVGFAFSQVSQQYHDEKDAKFVLPQELRSHPLATEKWLQAVRQAKLAYKDILNAVGSDPDLEKTAGAKERRRAIRSAARSVLPNATETKIVVTANARAIRHFLRVRGDIVGDLEMRRVSALLLKLMRAEAPSMFEDFELTQLEDGTPIVQFRQQMP